MIVDPEKADAEVDHNVPQDLDGPILHPEVSTTRDGESSKKEDGGGSLHSQTSKETGAVPERPEAPPSAQSKPASLRPRTLTTVPRGERRGLLGRLSIIPEVTRPYDYPNSTKWLITLIVALAAAAAPLGSAIFFRECFTSTPSISGLPGYGSETCRTRRSFADINLAALAQLSADFHTTPTLTNLSVAMYMLSMSIFPLWWSSFSETLGRRTIYLVSFALFTVWNIVAAISTSIGMLIVMRILGGGAAASVQAVGAGTIADIWEPRERGRAMGIFYLGPLLGPLLAPIIGGALSEVWGWRSTQWFQAIYGGVLLIVLTFCLPETLAKRTPLIPPEQLANDGTAGQQELTHVSTRQSVQRNTKQAAAIFKRCIIDPLSVIGFLRFPAVFATVYLASVAFGTLYILNVSIQETFSQPPYNFKVIIVGLMYIPGSLGYVAAALIGGRWTDAIMHREARAAGRYDESGKLILQPEDRMRENAMLAAAIFPAGLVWYGWTSEKGIFWIVPLIANFFFGFGSMIIFGTSTTM